MSGKYGCPWTNIMCIQGCGCCRDCNPDKKDRCNEICGIYRNYKNEPEMEGKKHEE